MKNRSLYILAFFATSFAFAQVNLYSEVNTKEARVNSPVIFTIVLEVSGDDLVQETPLKLPDFSKFNYDYASEQNTYIDPVRKIRINKMAYQFYLDPKQTGNIKIGSALVKINGKMYKTEPIDIVVKDLEKKPVVANNIQKNMYLNMHVEEKEVYKDEPVVAVLKAYSKTISNLRNIEPTKFGSSKNISIKSIANFDESIEESSDNDYSSKVVGMFVIIPKVVGHVEVPACEVSVAHKSDLVSNKVKLNVKKLPDGAPNSYNDAVGKYDFKVEIIDKSKENFEVNKAFNVAVKVSGNGNISPALLPKILPSDQFETYEPKIINNSYATAKGLLGEIEAQYVIIPKVRGDINIITEAFSYFDPKEERYIDLGQKSVTLKAVSSQDIANAKTTLQKVNDYTNNVLTTVDSPVINTDNLKIEDNKKFGWKAIIFNLIFILIAGLLLIFGNKKYRDRKRALEKKKEFDAKPISNIAETEDAIRSQLGFDIDSHLEDLKNKINSSNQEYFSAVDSFVADANHFCQSKYGLSIVDYIKNNEGQNHYEDYKKLMSKIELEKYSPFSNLDNRKEIISQIKDVYSVIED